MTRTAERNLLIEKRRRKNIYILLWRAILQHYKMLPSSGFFFFVETARAAFLDLLCLFFFSSIPKWNNPTGRQLTLNFGKSPSGELQSQPCASHLESRRVSAHRPREKMNSDGVTHSSSSRSTSLPALVYCRKGLLSNRDNRQIMRHTLKPNAI